jgi:8-oxo-dGTP diphosphatase
MADERRLHVVAAAMVDQRGRVLLQRRAAGAHQGGLWEFPGGKLEPGEGREEALARELDEELGVCPQAMRPLISVPHDYDDRRVLLDVWCVERWQGEVRAKENQPLAWVHPGDFARYQLPAADKPVLSALRLPEMMLITRPVGDDVPAWCDAVRRCVARGLSLVQVRSPQTDSRQLSAVIAALLESISEASLQVRVMVNGGPEAVAAMDIAGVHLTAQRLWQFNVRPIAEGRLLGVSCHHADDLHQAARIGADFAVLGPVAKTSSHPDTAPMGWPMFTQLVGEACLPVYALGGLGRDDVARAQASGAQGVAAISAFWE